MDEQDALGATTARYPSEAEQHEQRGWDDVLLLDDELEPTRRRGSLDKVPRRWSAVVALVMLSMGIGVGAVAAGFALFKWKSEEPGAMSPSRQAPAEAPRIQPKPMAQPMPQPMAQPIAQPLPPPVAQPRPPTQEPAQVPALAPEPSQAAVPPDLEGAERLRRDAIAVRKRRQRAEADYVWSQELKALVPAEYMERPPMQPSAPPDVRKRRQQRRSEDDYVWSQELKRLVPAEYMEKPPVQPSAPPDR